MADKAYGLGAVEHSEMRRCYFRITKIAKASCGLSQDVFRECWFTFYAVGACIAVITVL